MKDSSPTKYRQKFDSLFFYFYTKNNFITQVNIKPKLNGIL